MNFIANEAVAAERSAPAATQEEGVNFVSLWMNTLHELIIQCNEELQSRGPNNTCFTAH